MSVTKGTIGTTTEEGTASEDPTTEETATATGEAAEKKKTDKEPTGDQSVTKGTLG